VQVGIDEHLLNEVLGGIAVAEHRCTDPPNRVLKQPNEPGERLGIAS
jgi:hypothetical protein